MIRQPVLNRRVLLLLLVMSTPCHTWDARQLQRAVVVDGRAINFPVFALYRLPGTQLKLTTQGGIALLAGPGGAAAASNPPRLDQHLALQLPLVPGWYAYRVANRETGEEMLLNVHLLTPYSAMDAQGKVGGYRVGHYPKERLHNLEIYDPPRGFIKLTEADSEVQLSPNFRVGQFPSKQSGGYPKYLALRPALMIKLEKILRALNEAGHDIAGLHVMSGYRTPFYNRAIGNVQYSRHLWGGAADIYVDVSPRDGTMDDLNRDGVLNKQDAVWLADFIDGMSRNGEFTTPGGVGIYGSNAAHGPFVHVDVRGYRARW